MISELIFRLILMIAGLGTLAVAVLSLARRRMMEIFCIVWGCLSLLLILSGILLHPTVWNSYLSYEGLALLILFGVCFFWVAYHICVGISDLLRRMSEVAMQTSLLKMENELLKKGFMQEKTKELLLIIPAFNESGNIIRLIKHLEEANIRELADILVIDDGSEDGTRQKVESMHYLCLSNFFNQGYGKALQIGYKYAVNKGYSYVIQMDADGQHDVCNIRMLYEELKKQGKEGERADIVLGSRFLPGGQSFSISWEKKLGIQLFRFVIRLCTGKKITDPTTGLQGLSYKTVYYYSQYGCFDDRYPDANMIMQMLLSGYCVREIPAVMHERTEGKSMHSGMKAVNYIMRMAFSISAVYVREKLLRKGNNAFFSPGEFQETTQYLDNPGQGWYQIFTYDAGVFFTPQDEKQHLPEGKIALIRISIEKYRSRSLTEEGLDNIRRILQFFDNHGVDLILRITYDLEGKGLEREPDLFSQVKEHLNQISDIVREFENRILVFQGLLVGSWGEMHNSKFLSEKRLQDLERAFRSQGNENVWLALRRPVFLRMLMGTEDVSVGKRTLFDDAIGSSETDMGTFGEKSRNEVSWKDAWGRTDEIAFMNQICATAPFGGEALLPERQYRVSAWEIIETMRKMHLSYLNCQHDKQVLELWKKECIKSRDVWNGITAYNYIGCHMGYRFCVRKVSLTDSKKGIDWLLSVEIENTGFGNLMQEAQAELIWINRAGERNCQHLDWDARKWSCGCRTVCTALIYPQEGNLYLKLRRKWDGSRILFSNPMEQNMLYLGTMLFKEGGKKRG